MAFWEFRVSARPGTLPTAVTRVVSSGLQLADYGAELARRAIDIVTHEL